MFVLDAEDNRIEAVKDGRVIGYLNYVARDDYIEQHQIFVEEKERRKGIAEGLLKELIKVAKQKKVNKIGVIATPDPEREVFGKWLVRMGFKPTGEEGNRPQWILKI